MHRAARQAARVGMASLPPAAERKPTTFADAELSTLDASGKLVTHQSAALLGSGKVILVGLPGAFTPLCSAKHVPGFERLSSEFFSCGVNQIYVATVNDPWVCAAWACDLKLDQIKVLADPAGDFARRFGVEQIVPPLGNPRSARYAAFAENGQIKYFGLDTDGFEKSSAEAVLAYLRSI